MKHKVLQKIFSSASDLTLIEHKKQIIELGIKAIDIIASGFSNPLTEDIVVILSFGRPRLLKKALELDRSVSLVGTSELALEDQKHYKRAKKQAPFK